MGGGVGVGGGGQKVAALVGLVVAGACLLAPLPAHGRRAGRQAGGSQRFKSKAHICHRCRCHYRRHPPGTRAPCPGRAACRSPCAQSSGTARR